MIQVHCTCRQDHWNIICTMVIEARSHAWMACEVRANGSHAWMTHTLWAYLHLCGMGQRSTEQDTVDHWSHFLKPSHQCVENAKQQVARAIIPKASGGTINHQVLFLPYPEFDACWHLIERETQWLWFWLGLCGRSARAELQGCCCFCCFPKNFS